MLFTLALTGVDSLGGFTYGGQLAQGLMQRLVAHCVREQCSSQGYTDKKAPLTAPVAILQRGIFSRNRRRW